MLEITHFVFSSFWVWLGTLMLLFVAISATGWAINAILLGWRGDKCGDVSLFKIS